MVSWSPDALADATHVRLCVGGRCGEWSAPYANPGTGDLAVGSVDPLPEDGVTVRLEILDGAGDLIGAVGGLADPETYCGCTSAHMTVSADGASLVSS